MADTTTSQSTGSTAPPPPPPPAPTPATPVEIDGHPVTGGKKSSGCVIAGLAGCGCLVLIVIFCIMFVTIAAKNAASLLGSNSGEFAGIAQQVLDQIPAESKAGNPIVPFFESLAGSKPKVRVTEIETIREIPVTEPTIEISE